MIEAKIICDVCNRDNTTYKDLKFHSKYVRIVIWSGKDATPDRDSEQQMDICVLCMNVLTKECISNMIADGITSTVTQIEHEKKTDLQG